MSPLRTLIRIAPSTKDIASGSGRRTVHFGSSAVPLNSSLKSVRQLSATAIVKLTVLVASTLPVRSVERYSIR